MIRSMVLTTKGSLSQRINIGNYTGLRGNKKLRTKNVREDMHVSSSKSTCLVEDMH